MSRFTQEEEVKILKEARDLTATIEAEEEELKELRAARFESMPSAPVKKVLPQPKKLQSPQKVQPQYPPAPRANYSFSEHIKAAFKEDTVKSVLLLILPVIWLAVMYFSYSGKLNEMNKELAKDPEYLKAREEAEMIAAEKQKELDEKYREEQEKLDEKYREEQKILDEEYDKLKQHYDTVTLPDYNKRLEEWSNKQEIKIHIIENEIELNKESLEELYGETKLVSAKYREIWMLDWLYEDMSTSEHDLSESITLLNNERQLEAIKDAGDRTNKAVNNMRRDMNLGLGAVYAAVDEGNYLQSETASLLAKTRRDINIGNVAAASQRRKTNKYLDELINGKKK